jgi:outer membrane protein assembly factor BamB
MRLSAALAALAACVAPAAAVFEDDAYHVDFHYALLGLPHPEATFFAKPYAGSKASLLYALSRNQTIGAINPKDGALVWRQQFPAASPGRAHLRSAHGQDTVVSAAGGRIAAWSASDGRLVWEAGSGDATVEDLEMLEQDALVLLAGGVSSTVQRLDGKTGRAKWTFEDTRSATPPLLCGQPLTR